MKMSERFTSNGKLYKTIEAKNWGEHCVKCAFLNNECEKFNDDIPRCEAVDREDRKNVYFLEVKTNFDLVAESPKDLAENLVYSHHDEFGSDEWFGVTGDGIRGSFKTRDEAVIATLEWLDKEVEE